MIINRNNLERQLRRREKRRLADLNRNDRTVFRVMLQVTLTALAILIGIGIWFWAAYEQSVMEAYAAVVQKNHLSATWGPGAEVVGPIPEQEPEGQPPAAVDGTMVATMPDAEKVEAVGEPREVWESLGVWKLTAYCPLECCNGKDRAWKTASGAPMVVGDTVATARLPFGTKLKVRGKVYTVVDRGTPYGTLDILHWSDAECYIFGVQYAEVFILR